MQNRSTPRGTQWDRAFMKAQLQTHEYLRDLTEGFVNNSANVRVEKERHGRHIAMASLAAIKEHVVHCKHI